MSRSVKQIYSVAGGMGCCGATGPILFLDTSDGEAGATHCGRGAAECGDPE